MLNTPNFIQSIYSARHYPQHKISIGLLLLFTVSIFVLFRNARADYDCRNVLHINYIERISSKTSLAVWIKPSICGVINFCLLTAICTC